MRSVPDYLVIIRFILNGPVRRAALKRRPIFVASLFQQNRWRPIVFRWIGNNRVSFGNCSNKGAIQHFLIGNGDNSNGLDVHIETRLELDHGRRIDNAVFQKASIEDDEYQLKLDDVEFMPRSHRRVGADSQHWVTWCTFTLGVTP
jgi:hypothetical protein